MTSNMTTSPSSSLSAEAKEFVPLVQTPTRSIPLYVDENTIASIYSSDQSPFMIQTIYPMMISNSKMADLSANNLLSFPEIEFHIQSSQQQQFHIDSCSTLVQVPSTGAPSTNAASQIVLLPANAAAAAAGTTVSAATSGGYYPGAQLIYSASEQASTFYPMDYNEQPLINFSQQQPALFNKNNRNLSQQQSLHRPSSFRQQHGNNSSLYRTGNRASGGNVNNNRNSYYDYHSRRNGSSYMSHTGRGNSSNSKRISSSYHQQDYNHYYHHPSTRSRGYAPRSIQYNDEQRKDVADYYNHDKDAYENDYQTLPTMNDDGTPFEFRPEDFPSLPLNQQSDKTPTQSVTTNNTRLVEHRYVLYTILHSYILRSIASWNAIVSAPRPHSTSPHSAPQSSLQSQDQRSDRSRSINTKVSSTNERKLSNSAKSNNKVVRPTMPTVSTVIPIATKSKSKSPHRASKAYCHEEPLLPSSNHTTVENDYSKDDGFMQTKQQQRRLRRKNKMKDESLTTFERSAFTMPEDQHCLPNFEEQVSLTNPDSRSDTHSKLNVDISSETTTTASQIDLPGMFQGLNTHADIQQHSSDTNTNTSTIISIVNINALDSKDDQECQTTTSKSSIKQSNGTGIVRTDVVDE
jgi:hypothetical protein